MTFNVAMSGLRAAHKRLEVAGNNIANVGTVGFKSSRAEFSALYSSAQLGSSVHNIGDGVRLASVSQNFNAGDAMSSDGAPLDMRIQGGGFFVISERGALSYTRAGAFHKDAEDFIVDSAGKRLQGYGVDDDGQVQVGMRTDLKIDTSVMQARAAHELKQAVNLGSAMPSLATLREFNPAEPGSYTRVITRTVSDAGIAEVAEIVDANGVVTRPGVPAVAPADHEFKQYLVKTDADRWTLYVTVDGRNPLDPGSDKPLQWSLQKRPDGSAVLAGGSEHIKKVSDAEFSLSGWQPARQVNGQWLASVAGAGGPLALSLMDGADHALSEVDPLMERPVPVFRPGDLASFNKTFSSTLHDSLGNPHELQQYFVKDGINSWKMHVLVNGRNPANPHSADPLTASLLFDANGTLASVTGGLGLELDRDALVLKHWLPARISDSAGRGWVANGAAAHPEGVRIQVDRITQYNADTAQLSSHVDGHASGMLIGLGVGRDGALRATYTNGLSRDIGQVMLARFANEQGLLPGSDTHWSETHASGAAMFDVPGAMGMGAIIAQSLEASNVELSAQLIELVQAQTAFQANSKAISTQTTVLQTLIQST
ncbi:flagellar hook protein FlgE [Pseudomonas sp. 21LCFQ010]|uniref:flagellar hook protein FlgE n=1 Tax=Pseudomonas sp. 21LCFQ010 TaxID=2957506 RepID=UPI0020981D8A|nr:flagellar hook protein FlgE [Pseudomonas sp. 21LCFQ010]MCO8163431.1 flagellar hook protein FlgE [Pseudomonas sp. 21LCFQ010]